MIPGSMGVRAVTLVILLLGFGATYAIATEAKDCRDANHLRCNKLDHCMLCTESDGKRVCLNRDEAQSKLNEGSFTCTSDKLIKVADKVDSTKASKPKPATDAPEPELEPVLEPYGRKPLPMTGPEVLQLNTTSVAVTQNKELAEDSRGSGESKQGPDVVEEGEDKEVNVDKKVVNNGKKKVNKDTANSEVSSREKQPEGAVENKESGDGDQESTGGQDVKIEAQQGDTEDKDASQESSKEKEVVKGGNEEETEEQSTKLGGESLDKDEAREGQERKRGHHAKWKKRKGWRHRYQHESDDEDSEGVRDKDKDKEGHGDDDEKDKSAKKGGKHGWRHHEGHEEEDDDTHHSDKKDKKFKKWGKHGKHRPDEDKEFKKGGKHGKHRHDDSDDDDDDDNDKNPKGSDTHTQDADVEAHGNGEEGAVAVGGWHKHNHQNGSAEGFGEGHHHHGFGHEHGHGKFWWLWHGQKVAHSGSCMSYRNSSGCSADERCSWCVMGFVKKCVRTAHAKFLPGFLVKCGADGTAGNTTHVPHQQLSAPSDAPAGKSTAAGETSEGADARGSCAVHVKRDNCTADDGCAWCRMGSYMATCFDKGASTRLPASYARCSSGEEADDVLIGEVAGSTDSPCVSLNTTAACLSSSSATSCRWCAFTEGGVVFAAQCFSEESAGQLPTSIFSCKGSAAKEPKKATKPVADAKNTVTDTN